MAEIQVGAIILAAGLSSRMGSFKPMLQVDGTTLLARTITLFRNVGLKEIIVVCGHRSQTLMPLASKYKVMVANNPLYTDGMYSSVRTGVAALSHRCHGFFLLPVDIPFVRNSTVRRLVNNFIDNPQIPVYYPCHQGRKGHPPLINGRLIEEIVDYDGQGGLRTFLHRYKNGAVNVEVDDPFIHLDLDIPDDLLRMQQLIR